MESVAAAWVDLIHRLNEEQGTSFGQSDLLNSSCSWKDPMNFIPFHRFRLAYWIRAMFQPVLIITNLFRALTRYCSEILSSFTHSSLSRTFSAQRKELFKQNRLRGITQKLNGICAISINDKIEFRLDPFRWALTSCQMFTDIVYEVMKSQIIINVNSMTNDLKKVLLSWH